jgi:arginase
LAVKIVRQPKNIALLGAPTSAASLAAGHERGPQALRAAGLVERLTAAGFVVRDYGDCATRVSAPDEEHPRARNVDQARATVEELRPKIEVAVKSGALPLVLGGDDTIVLATVAGCRRYYRNVSLIDLDRDAGLNVPATTPSGCVDGMVLSHVIGRGAPELVRFWGEPPLVREPGVALFGVERLDEPEQRFLTDSPLRRYFAADVQSKGAAASAEEALEHAHGRTHEFVLHIDLDVISGDDFSATNLSAPGGLRFDEVRQALAVFARQPTLAAIEVSAYNPALDPDGAAARRVIDLLVEVLSPRLDEGSAAAEPKQDAVPAPAVASEPAAADTEKSAAPVETPNAPSEPAASEESAEPSSPTKESIESEVPETPGDSESPSS